jgi:hypothetical protein
VYQVLTLASAQLKCELAENQRKDNGQLLVFQTTVSRKTLKSGVLSKIAVFCDYSPLKDTELWDILQV